MRLECDPALQLQAAGYRATLLPSAGGRVASLRRAHEGHWHDLLVPLEDTAFDEHQWPKAGAFPMLPFANRLPAEGFWFQGRQVKPPPGPQGHAMHGFMHRRPWQVVAVSQESAELQCEHAGETDAWPWAFLASQRVSLGPAGLSVRLTLTNLSGQPMPMGMGWHPYHPTRPDATAEALAFRARHRRALDAQGRACEAVGAAVFGMAHGETAAFGGWDGKARMNTSCGLGVHVQTEGWDSLVLHRSPGGDYLCLEPVTTCPGWLGRPGSPVLAAGASRSATWQASAVRPA